VDPQLFRTKNIYQLVSGADRPDKRVNKSPGWLSLAALGIGAIIGSGIFVLTGTAAAGESVEFPSILKAPLLEVLMHGRHALGLSERPGAVPAIALSFLLVAIVCGLAGLCYAELASMIPIAGSAYTYTYATLGELNCLDHRLGPHPRVRGIRHGRGRRLLIGPFVYTFYGRRDSTLSSSKLTEV
jgi:basic amino acid/polyamine antiporter, APA family